MTMVATTNAAKAAEFEQVTTARRYQRTRRTLKRSSKRTPIGETENFARGDRQPYQIEGSSTRGHQAWVVNSLIEYGRSLKKGKLGGKKPVENSNYRARFEILAVAALEASETAPDIGAAHYYRRKYAPSRATRIRAKFKIRGPRKSGPTVISSSTPDVVEVSTATLTTKETVATVVPTAPETRLPLQANPRGERANAGNEDDRGRSSTDLEKAPKEICDKIITQARKLIAMTGDKKPRLRVASLAAQVAKAGDRRDRHHL